METLVCNFWVSSVFGPQLESVVLSEEPGVIAEIETFARVVHVGVVLSAVCKLIAGLAAVEGSLEALVRDTVAVAVHLEIVLELDEAVDVGTLVGIAFETLSDDLV